MTRSLLRNVLCALGLMGFAASQMGAACQRSATFQRDQEAVPVEAQAPAPAGSTYGDRTATSRSSTQRVEAMGQPKKRLVVFNFWNDTPVKITDLGNFAADELRRGLYFSQRLILPSDAKTDMNTQDFISGERVRVAQLIREGRRMGVAVLLVGRVTKVVFRQRGDDVGLLRQKQSLAAADVEIKLFDVSAGREILAVSKSGEASSNTVVALDSQNVDTPQFRAELTKFAVREAVNGLVPTVLKAVEKMSWEGRIAKISGTKVFVNAGKQSGLVGGDILRVLTPGEDIYDPGTGAYLGRSPGQLKGTLEVVDFLGTDGAISEVHTGANFQEGDAVMLY